MSTAYKGVGGGCVYSLQGGGRGLCLQLTIGWEGAESTAYKGVGGAVSTAYKGVGGGCVYSLQGGGRGLCLQLTEGRRLDILVTADRRRILGLQLTEGEGGLKKP